MITFSECVVMCAGNQELVQEFNRLTGFHMGGASGCTCPGH